MSHNTHPQESTYTPEVLADIWVASYRFSQGAPALQKHIVGYLCEEVIPDFTLENDDTMVESFALAHEKILKIINSDSHVGDNGVKAEGVSQDFNENVVKTIKEDEERVEGSDSLLKIAGQTLYRDASYLPANDPNKRRKFSTPDNHYFSYAVRYILLQAQTGLPAINYMFAQAQLYLAPLAGNDIQTYDFEEGSTVKVPRKTFSFQDILEAHIEFNQRDIMPLQEALARLGIRKMPDDAARAST